MMNSLPYIFDKYSKAFYGKKLFAKVFSKYRLREHSGITESSSLCGSDESRHNLYFESLAQKNRRGISIFIDEYVSILNLFQNPPLTIMLPFCLKQNILKSIHIK